MEYIEEAYYKTQELWFYKADVKDATYKFEDTKNYPGSLDAFKLS